MPSLRLAAVTITSGDEPPRVTPTPVGTKLPVPLSFFFSANNFLDDPGQRRSDPRVDGRVGERAVCNLSDVEEALPNGYVHRLRSRLPLHALPEERTRCRNKATSEASQLQVSRGVALGQPHGHNP